MLVSVDVLRALGHRQIRERCFEVRSQRGSQHGGLQLLKGFESLRDLPQEEVGVGAGAERAVGAQDGESLGKGFESVEQLGAGGGAVLRAELPPGGPCFVKEIADVLARRGRFGGARRDAGHSSRHGPIRAYETGAPRDDGGDPYFWRGKTPYSRAGGRYPGVIKGVLRVGLVVLVLALSAPQWLPLPGTLLVVDEQPTQADAALVLDGVGTGALEGAERWREAGLVRDVVVVEAPVKTHALVTYWSDLVKQGLAKSSTTPSDRLRVVRA